MAKFHVLLLLFGAFISVHSSAFVEFTSDGEGESLETIGERVPRAALPEYPDYWSQSDITEGRVPSE